MGMYESPIKIIESTIDSIYKDIVKKKDDAIFAEIKSSFGVDLDKEELLRALQYDRDQYNKGYADGKRDSVVHGRWIIKSKETLPFEYVAVAECSECHAETESNRSLYISGFPMDMVDRIVRREVEAQNMGLGNYCSNCGADMRERKDDA